MWLPDGQLDPLQCAATGAGGRTQAAQGGYGVYAKHAFAVVRARVSGQSHDAVVLAF